MLQFLLKSQTRKAILIQLYTHQGEQEFHLRALARATKEHVYGVQREVKNLEKLGIIKQEKKFNRNLIKLQEKHPYYYDLMRMVYKDHGLGAHIIKKHKKLSGTDLLFLTHFYIENKRKSKFDVDLLIIGKPDLDITNNIIHEAEQSLNRDILYSTMPTTEFYQRQRQQDTFVWNILKNNYVILLGNENKVLK